MAEHKLSTPGSVVKKSNALARAAWTVKSVYEPRLVALVASQVRKDDQDFQDYVVSIRELLGTADDGGKSYKLVAEVVDGLLGRVLTIPRPHGWAKCNVFSWVEYDGAAGVIRARFDPGLKEHYLNLNSHFTQYSLTEFLRLPSTYSQRLFEILKSWDDSPSGEILIDLADLFKMLDVPASHRKDFRNFRIRVLDKAHADITAKTSFRYEWEAIKKGKAVTAIRFVFRRGAKLEAVAAKAQARTSAARNKALIAAVKCWEECQGACEPKKNAQCEICGRLVRA